MVSEELDELFEICDELVVMSEAKFLLKSKQKMSALKRSVRWMSGLWPEAKSSDEFSFSLYNRQRPSRFLSAASPFIAVLLTLDRMLDFFCRDGQRSDAFHVRVYCRAFAHTAGGWGGVRRKNDPLILCALGLLVCYRANVLEHRCGRPINCRRLPAACVTYELAEASQLYVIWVICFPMVGGGALTPASWPGSKTNAMPMKS